MAEIEASPLKKSIAQASAPTVTNAPFPVRTRQAAGAVDAIRTEVMAMYFADKIMLTISQEGRLAHWIHVPLESIDPNQSDRRLVPDEEGSQLLPLPNLTATTVLGLSGSERDTLGQLFATQLASAIVVQRPEESRLLVVGLGLKNAQLGSDDFLEILELALKCI